MILYVFVFVILNNSINRLQRVSDGATFSSGLKYKYKFDILQFDKNRTSGCSVYDFVCLTTVYVYYATKRKVAISIPEGVIGIFQ